MSDIYEKGGKLVNGQDKVQSSKHYKDTKLTQPFKPRISKSISRIFPRRRIRTESLTKGYKAFVHKRLPLNAKAANQQPALKYALHSTEFQCSMDDLDGQCTYEETCNLVGSEPQLTLLRRHRQLNTYCSLPELFDEQPIKPKFEFNSLTRTKRHSTYSLPNFYSNLPREHIQSLQSLDSVDVSFPSSGNIFLAQVHFKKSYTSTLVIPWYEEKNESTSLSKTIKISNRLKCQPSLCKSNHSCDNNFYNENQRNNLNQMQTYYLQNPSHLNAFQNLDATQKVCTESESNSQKCIINNTENSKKQMCRIIAEQSSCKFAIPPHREDKYVLKPLRFESQCGEAKKIVIEYPFDSSEGTKIIPSTKNTDNYKDFSSIQFMSQNLINEYNKNKSIEEISNASNNELSFKTPSVYIYKIYDVLDCDKISEIWTGLKQNLNSMKTKFPSNESFPSLIVNLLNISTAYVPRHMTRLFRCVYRDDTSYANDYEHPDRALIFLANSIQRFAINHSIRTTVLLAGSLCFLCTLKHTICS